MVHSITYHYPNTEISTREILLNVEGECSVLKERVIDGAKGVDYDYSAIVEYYQVDGEGNSCWARNQRTFEYFTGPYIGKTVTEQLEKLAIEGA